MQRCHKGEVYMTLNRSSGFRTLRESGSIVERAVNSPWSDCIHTQACDRSSRDSFPCWMCWSHTYYRHSCRGTNSPNNNAAVCCKHSCSRAGWAQGSCSRDPWEPSQASFRPRSWRTALWLSRDRSWVRSVRYSWRLISLWTSTLELEWTEWKKKWNQICPLWLVKKNSVKGMRVHCRRLKTRYTSAVCGLLKLVKGLWSRGIVPCLYSKKWQFAAVALT